MKDFQVFQGKDLNHAIELAEETLKVTRDELIIEILEQGSSGFLGLGGTPTRIKVRIKEPHADIDKDTDAPEQTVDRDGMLEIKNGEFKVIPPLGRGKYPTIYPTEKLVIKVNDSIITKPTFVSPGDRIEVEIRQADKKNFDISIAGDKMTATLTVYPPYTIERILLDSEPTNRLQPEVTETLLDAEVPAREDIMAAIREAGITYGLIPEAIEEALGERIGEPVEIAHGSPMVPPRDGGIELLYDKADPIESYLNKITINLRERSQFHFIQIGQVVARYISPVEGSPGTTITGETVPCPEPKPVNIIAGEGLRQVDDTLVATTGGRVEIKDKTISVIPLLVVDSDVSLETGNIHFYGDVVIKGGVQPGMVVEADGVITIAGLVERSEIMAHSGGIMLKGVLNSVIKAGNDSAYLSKILPSAQSMLDSLIRLSEAIKEVKARLQALGRGNITTNDIVQLLVENKFRDVPRTARQLMEVFKEKEIKLTKSEQDMFERITRILAPGLTENLEQRIDDVIDDLKEWVEKSEQELTKKTPVHLAYAQNSKIYATGAITVEGQGCIGSLLSAGDTIIIKGYPGSVRGGHLIAHGDIFVNDIGSEGSLTRANVPEKHKIICNRISGQCLFGIGRKSIRIDDPRGPTVLALDEDKNIMIK